MSLLTNIREHATIRYFLKANQEKLPRWVVPAIIALAVMSWVPLVLLARVRATKSDAPRIQIFPDMDQQQKYKAQAANPFYDDGRAMRLPVEGTVARGELMDNELYQLGRVGEEFTTAMPIRVTAAAMQRGQERFNIYCVPCHGLDGSGNGIVSVRAEALQEGTWIPPVSFHSETVRGRENGHIFNTISNGIRNMPAYDAQIPVHDRWAIVAYVRALQRSQNASLEDVPVDRRDRLP